MSSESSKTGLTRTQLGRLIAKTAEFGGMPRRKATLLTKIVMRYLKQYEASDV